MSAKSRIVIIGGGPGGYEAALVAAQLGADVTVVDDAGLGGAAVLTDVVPSKTLIATAEVLSTVGGSQELGITGLGRVAADLGAVNRRVKALARAQSEDIRLRLEAEGVRIVVGRGVLDGPSRVRVRVEGVGDGPGGDRGRPGRRGRHRPDLHRRPSPGAPRRAAGRRAGAHLDPALRARDPAGETDRGRLGSDRGRVRQRLPRPRGAGRAGLQPRSGAAGGGRRRGRGAGAGVRPAGDGGAVPVAGPEREADRRRASSSPCPTGARSRVRTACWPSARYRTPVIWGWRAPGVELTASGHVQVDRVSRTSARGIYAAGDCTGVLPLASVAAMQGRKAMWHALGDAVSPLDLRMVSSNVFTAPEIATVGVSQAQVDGGEVKAVTGQAAAGPQRPGQDAGHPRRFREAVRLTRVGPDPGGTIVAPRASELIHPIALALMSRLTVDEVSSAFTVYPSLSGSVAEAARQLHQLS